MEYSEAYALYRDDVERSEPSVRLNSFQDVVLLWT